MKLVEILQKFHHFSMVVRLPFYPPSPLETHNSLEMQVHQRGYRQKTFAQSHASRTTIKA